MNTGRHSTLISLSVFICVYMCLTFFLNACGPILGTATPTAFYILPSTPQPSPSGPASPGLTPLASAPTPTPAGPCTDDLHFIKDLTVPDGTQVQPGEAIDKQWLVENSGTCNWDSDYRLKLVDGDPLGVPSEQALYPARAGAQVTLRILFTAPQGAGRHTSTWQAFDPQGRPFGDTFYLDVTVGGG
jgi:hypothetical protein